MMKTVILMVGLMMLFMYVGNLVGGEQGMFMAFLLACGMNFFSYFFSDKLVLKQYKAQAVNSENAPELYGIVAELAQKAGLPMPKVYIVPEEVPNAFATGRNPQHAAVAATQGLLRILDKDEIEGVLAHEMSHVKHHDILIGSIAAVFAGAISMLANTARVNTNSRNSRNSGNGGVLAVIFMPIAAAIVRMAISRTREYKADEGAAYLTRHPEWLMSALTKLEGYAKNYQMRNANSQTAHLFIINPFSGMQNAMAHLFSTHPSTKDRLARLEKLKKMV
ncbi:MAG: zinc metalloprotease HtpX [Alphaproteobacteria bacterium]|nr:zinc metalloprotease HtpX [Alphaproteobacteria bacterium]